MARRSQCSSAGDNPLDPNYLPPHYREEYRIAINALIEADLEGYYGFLQDANVVDFLSQSEIEYIKCMVRGPRQIVEPDRRFLVGDGDGSSDTYWPVQSDLDAPGLDLGWPQQHRFVGPTEITTLVNPSDPQMPTIKEHVRRMIKNAQQVVAVVMDVFTDVDIFAEMLNAAMRKVAVYVLLDEVNAHQFEAMVHNCKVNLDEITFMRVRTVSGSTYFSHTGKSFKGQMMNRFMLVDCRVALSGSYSFMWSFEKIHRCMAHVFLGQLVATFDEEFRILYAQSEPLVTENPMIRVEDYGNLPGRHYDPIYKREYPSLQHTRPEWHGRSFDENMVVGPNLLPFRRVGSKCSSTDEHLSSQIHPSQQFRGEHAFVDQRKLIKGPNTKELSDFRRHSTEVPSQAYIFPPNSGHRGKQHLEDLEIQRTHFPREQYFNQRTGPEPSFEMYRKPRDPGYQQQLDQFSEPGSAHEMDLAEPVEDYDHVQRYLQSHPAGPEPGPPGKLLLPVQSNPRRHSIGQSYACQISPTQPNLPEQKYLSNIHNKRQEQKEGLRDWRISSYLSALQHPGQEDMTQLQRTSSCDNVSYIMQGRSDEPDILEKRLTLPENIADHTFIKNAKQIQPATSEPTSGSSCTTEGEKVEDMQNRETKETNLIHEEFFRRRPNLPVQRSSRLRHSLIFNSNLEQHTSDEIRNSKDGDNPLKHSPVVTNILEKKRPAARELFQWSNTAKSFCDPSSESTSADLPQNAGMTSMENKDDNSQIPQKKVQQETNLASQRTQSQEVLPGSSPAAQVPSVGLQRSVSFIDMDNPECRLRFFKELAAKRKAEAQAKLSKQTQGRSTKEPDKPEGSLTNKGGQERESALNTTKKRQGTTNIAPAIPQICVGASQSSAAMQKGSETHGDKNFKHKLSTDAKITEKHSARSDSPCIPATATDAEKIKLKKKLNEEYNTSSNRIQEKHAPAAIPKLQLNTNPSLRSPNTTSPESMSTKTKSPTVSGSAGSSSPSVVSPNKLKSNSLSTSSGQLSTSNSSGTNVDPLKVPATESSKNLTPETGSDEHTAATNPDSSVHTTAIHTDQNSTSDQAKAVTSQHVTEKVIDQHPAELEIEPSQHPSESKTDVLQLPATETDISQNHTAIETGPLQQTDAEKTCPSQHPTATDTSQHSTTTETAPSEHRTEIPANMEPLQHLTATETGQDANTAETRSSQHPTETNIDTPQHTSAANGCPSQNSTLTEPGPFQHPTATKTDISQCNAKEVDSLQQPSTTETGVLEHPTAEKNYTLQHPTATEISPSTSTDTQHLTATQEQSPQQPCVSETSSSTLTDTQHLTATQEDSPQHPNVTETHPSQHLTVTKTDTPQDPSAPETQPSEHPMTETDPSHKPTATPTETDGGLSQQPTTTQVSFHPNPAQADSPQHPTATKNETLQHETASDTLQPVPSEPCNLVDTSSTSVPPQTETALGREVEIMPNTAPISDPMASTSSSTSLVKDTDTSAVETNSSTNKSTVNTPSPEVTSPTASLPSNTSAAQPEMSVDVTPGVDTQDETDSETATSSINHTSSPDDLSDKQKSLNTGSDTCSLQETTSDINNTLTEMTPDKCTKQTDEIIERSMGDTDSSPDEGTSSSITDSADTTLPTNNSQVTEPGSKETSSSITTPPSHETTKQTESLQNISHESPSDTTTPETSENVTVTEHSNRKESPVENSDTVNQQSLPTEKPTLSSLQSSTANVLSCSNLRDDTKVLLEQISAKNQNRASKLTSGDAKEDETEGKSNTGKQSYRYSRPKTWTDTASPEERENLLKKIQDMRKEKRIYSRFEAS